VLFEAPVLIGSWIKDYNQITPHSALGYRPPAPETILPGYGSTSLTLSVVQRLGQVTRVKDEVSVLNLWKEGRERLKVHLLARKAGL